jgi:hypothetical protein
VLLLEGSLDGVDVAGDLDVGEQELAIVREVGPGELGVLGVLVAREEERTKLAVPSGSDGVGSPLSSLVTPDWATTLYSNPFGSDSSPAGSSTSGP